MTQKSSLISCNLCPTPKPASWCTGCPRETWCEGETARHFVDARLKSHCDVLIVAESPVIPRVVDITALHQPYRDEAGKIINSTLENLRKTDAKLQALRVEKTYAVLCTSAGGEEPNKATLERCQTFLRQGLAARAALGEKPPVILAMGMTAVKALGIKAAKLADIQGRVLTGVQVGDVTYTVIVTCSTKALVSAPGVFTSFQSDFARALQMATAAEQVTVPLSELTKDYIIPVTLAEVKNVCDLIIDYTEDGVPAVDWAISADTETNTLFPHRKNLKLLAASFAWAQGRSTAIALWHKETPYDPEEAAKHVRRVLACRKKKIFHNAKYDLKVLRGVGMPVENVYWDAMLGEHALEEDKKGLYGLKELTRRFAPSFAAYADNLKAMQQKSEGDSQLDNIRRAQDEEVRAAAAALGGKKGKSKKTPKVKGQETGGFENVPLDTLLPYAAVDTDITRRLAVLQFKRAALEHKRLEALKEKVEKHPVKLHPVPRLCTSPTPTVDIVRNFSLPASRVLANMEFEGVRVDRPYLSTLQDKLGEVVNVNEAQLHAMVPLGVDKRGEPLFKLNNAAQVAKVLFSEGFIHPETGQRTYYNPLGDKSITKTAKGQLQTTAKVLQYLVARYECPFSATKLVYAKATKAKNTFCRNVWDLSSLDGYLHTNYNVHGTSTGRLSSSDENMQNVPKELSRFTNKKMFIPDDPDSEVFVNCDAKNAEVRIFAAYSRDAALIRSINEGEDTHCFLATKIIDEVRRTSADARAVLESMRLCDKQGKDSYPLTYEDFVNREKFKATDPYYAKLLDKFRTAIKRVVFGILYGAGPAKIAETIGISEEQARTIIDLLFKLFPAIPRYMATTKWELRTFGCVETYFGRRRRFSVQGAPKYQQGRAERQGVNFKIQSTSSEIVMDCLIAVDEPLRRDIGGRLLLTVHDSLGFTWPKKYLPQLNDFVQHYLVKRTGQKFPWLPVAFKWDAEVGPSYGELSSIDDYLARNPLRPVDLMEQAYSEEEVRMELSSPDERAA